MAMKCVWICSLPWENAGFGNGARGGHRHAGTGSTVSPVLWTESRTSGREPESIKNDQRRAQYYLFKCGTRRRRAGRGKQGNGEAGERHGRARARMSFLRGRGGGARRRPPSRRLERRAHETPPPLQRHLVTALKINRVSPWFCSSSPLSVKRPLSLS